MKQATFVVEIVIKDDSENLFIVRDRGGNVVKITKNAADIATFFDEVITSAKTDSNINKA